MNYKDLREKYKNFIYRNYKVEEDENYLIITFNFEIEGLASFNPVTKINKKDILNNNINVEFRNNLIFHLGLIEMISYYKATISENIIIEAGYLDEEQIKYLKKLIFNGLGEFLYLNKINISIENLVNIKIEHEITYNRNIDYNGTGNLVLLGGGKDSNVTLEILKDEDNTILLQNPKKVHLDCAKEALYDDNDICIINRTIDKELINLNNLGYLNGHTPFSSLLAFESYLVGYLMNKEFIILSNEESANEGTVIGTNINHQYSKSFEAEKDFDNYAKKHFNINLNYFSLLRPLNEYQIALLFSQYKKYHYIFKSCNVGSKGNDWAWCNNCPKCLFVYTILSPFLNKKELVDIFNEALFEKETLLNIFKELIGVTGVKPFECVGSYKEVRYAISKTIINYNGELPYLLKYYNDNYELDLSYDFEHKYNEINNLNEHFNSLVRNELEKYV